MFLNYLKRALRQIRFHRLHFTINLVGLSLGLASCFVMIIEVMYETSYDTFNTKIDRIYVATSERTSSGWQGSNSPLALREALRYGAVGIERVARSWVVDRSSVRIQDQTFEEKGFVCVDPELFDILTLPIVQGSLEGFRSEGREIILTERAARKYFTASNPIGQTLTLRFRESDVLFEVCAVMKDIPSNSSFVADILGPMSVAEHLIRSQWKDRAIDPITSWEALTVHTYILTTYQSDIDRVQDQLLKISRQHSATIYPILVHLLPLADVHLHSSHLLISSFTQGNITEVYAAFVTALVILLISCANYLLLNLGRVSLCTIEIGIRKVHGAGRGDLFMQYAVEAIVVTIAAFPVAVVLVEIFLQEVTELLGTIIPVSFVHTWLFLSLFFALTVVVGGVVGGYVSLYVSRFDPVRILKSKYSIDLRKPLASKILIFVEMVIFMTLTLSLLLIQRQLEFVRVGTMGFDPSRLVVLAPDNPDFGKLFASFKNELKSHAGVINVSAGIVVPGTSSRAVTRIPGKDDPNQPILVEEMFVDRDFVETMGFTLTSGVSLGSFPADGPKDICIVNEKAVRALGMQNPIGETVDGFRIVGVVKDFALHSFHEPIGPVILCLDDSYVGEIVVQSAPGFQDSLFDVLRRISARYNNGIALEPVAFEDRLGSLYVRDLTFATNISSATLLAIFIACLGVFGATMFDSRQRMREHGIRKVFGATAWDIYWGLIKRFAVVSLLAIVVSIPISRVLIDGWLNRFSYRISPGISDFLLAALLDALIVFTVVSYEALKAAFAPPASAIRYE